jgi:transitional endoplasmic reticulum ATPase
MASEPFTMIERRSTSSSHQVYDDYQKAYSGASFDLDVQLRGFLREQYPKHILTVVPENNVSLLYYAAAGKAFAKLDIESENALRYRGYVRGASPGVGRMAESVRFAKYDYRALDEDFVLYICQQGLYLYQYILKKPQKGEIITGNSGLTDALLAAIGEFARPEPIGDDIVYVFDGYWSASKDLYRQVQNASWDDVILDEGMKKSLVDIVKKFFDSKEVYDDLGVPWKRGVMFHGYVGLDTRS